MSFRHALFCAVCALLVCGFAGSVLAASPAPAARVRSVTPGAFVVRDGARLPLRLEDAVYAADQISTDATGKVQLRFADETGVSVAPDTRLKLADFRFDDTDKAGFAMNVARGLARVITGEVVKRNPEGFTITTPHATVGIRGTALTTDVRDPAKTIVILDQLSSRYVGVLNTATGRDTHMTRAGYSCEIGAAGTVLRPATPEEMASAQVLAEPAP